MPLSDEDIALQWGADDSDDNIAEDGHPHVVDGLPDEEDLFGEGYEMDFDGNPPELPGEALAVVPAPAGPVVPARRITAGAVKNVFNVLIAKCAEEGRATDVDQAYGAPQQTASMALVESQCKQPFMATVCSSASRAQVPPSVRNTRWELTAAKFSSLLVTTARVAMLVGTFGTTFKRSCQFKKIADEIVKDVGFLLTCTNATVFAEKLGMDRKQLWNGAFVIVFNSYLMWIYSMWAAQHYIVQWVKSRVGCCIAIVNIGGTMKHRLR